MKTATFILSAVMLIAAIVTTRVTWLDGYRVGVEDTTMLLNWMIKEPGK